jgi:aminoglycoside phosphotransferase (APT) family kinase protein
MLVMAEAPGTRDLNTWIKYLEKQQPLPPDVDLGRLERCMAMVAQTLSELHCSGIRPRGSRTFYKELADACKDLKLIRHDHPELARDIERILERLQMRMPQNERLVPCHGAFRPEQLMGNDQYLILLDWDGLTLAHPALDAASFLCRLRHVLITQPGKASELAGLAEVFRREFLSREKVAACELALYETLGLMDLALRAFRHSERREHIVTHTFRLVTEAERLLDRQESAV